LKQRSPWTSSQRLPANRPVRSSRSASARGGVVAARQPLPLNRQAPLMMQERGSLARGLAASGNYFASNVRQSNSSACCEVTYLNVSRS
jgi:hypothetical protein